MISNEVNSSFFDVYFIQIELRLKEVEKSEEGF